MAEQRFFRSIVIGGAALVGSATLSVICGSCGGADETPDAGCHPTARFQSSCPIVSLTTTCTGGPVSCDDGGVTHCQIGSEANPVTSSCTISVVLSDGTQATVDVHVMPIAGCDDTLTFPSAIGCKEADASDDVESGTSDASDDTSAPDGGVD